MQNRKELKQMDTKGVKKHVAREGKISFQEELRTTTKLPPSP
jgi:hypothetical protein